MLTALLEAAGVPAALHGDALVALDKLDKIGAEGVDEGVRGARHRRRTPARSALTFFVAGAPRHRARRSGGRSSRLRGDPGAHAVAEPAEPSSRSRESTPAAGRIRVDPSLARGLSYYTGAIMEIAVPDLAGSLGGGGRYDNLIGMFLGRDVPACGFSLGLERIIVVMTERDMFPADGRRAAPWTSMVTFWTTSRAADALTLAGGAAGRAACASTSIRSSRQARQAAQVRVEPRRAVSWRSSATTSSAAARSASRTCRQRRAGQRAARRGRGAIAQPAESDLEPA